MAKIALLIGVSEYQAGFTPLPKVRQDLEAMHRALQDHQTEGFDQIKVLRDPDLQTMRDGIEDLFTGCSREDVVLLFFSGHGIKDDQGRLYFATRDTRKAANGELRRATAVESGFVQEMMNNSRCKRQVIILDCCFSGAFAAGMGAKDSGTVDIAAQLGGEGRAVLTSSTSTQYSFEEQSADLSIYTRYIVEGLETGAADLNHDGWIEVEELHEYARSKVQETAPAMKPEIYAVKEGYKIRLTRARIGDPKLRYRQEADRYASRGEIPKIGRILLDTLRERLGLSTEEAAQIEADLLRPYREHLENLRRYREAVMAAAEVEYPFSDQTQSDLQHFQDVLGLRDEDVAPITAELAAQVAQEPTQPSQTASPTVLPQYRVEAPTQSETPSTPLMPVVQINHQSEESSILGIQWVRINIAGWALGVYVGMGTDLIILNNAFPHSSRSMLDYSTVTPISIALSSVVGWIVIGLAQWFLLRRQVHGNGWIWATIVGGTIGGTMFLALGLPAFWTNNVMLLIVSIVTGIVVNAVVCGLIQKWLLNSQIDYFGRKWIWINVRGWVIAMAVGIAVGLVVTFLVNGIVGSLYKATWNISMAIATAIACGVGGAVGGFVYGRITRKVVVRFLEAAQRK
jgi:hypothetical protein